MAGGTSRSRGQRQEAAAAAAGVGRRTGCVGRGSGRLGWRGGSTVEAAVRLSSAAAAGAWTGSDRVGANACDSELVRKSRMTLCSI